MLKTYYRLTKPGIVYGNAMSTLAAFLFASRWQFDLATLVATMIGITFVVAGACVYNNYLDRGIDANMSRTKQRALVLGTISNVNALIFGSVLSLLGLAFLFFVNVLSAFVALFGFVWYVCVYGWGKRTTHWSTVIGSAAGSVPIVVGYCAATGRLDGVALLLFLVLALWQMPHFYAIAMRRQNEYQTAGLPVLPLVKGGNVTVLQIRWYIAAWLICALSLTAFGAGFVYAVAMLTVGGVWFMLALGSAGDAPHWAKRVFGWSLIVLVVFSVALGIASITP